MGPAVCPYRERHSNLQVVLYTKYHVHSGASTHCPLERLKYTAHQVKGRREGEKGKEEEL